MPAIARSAIDLLPWRDVARARANKLLLGALGGVVAAGAVFIIVAAWLLDRRIELQERRVELLEQEAAVLEWQVAEARSLAGQGRHLLERMAAIRRLQANRQATVHVFDELANTLPDGLHYRRVEMQGASLRAQGVAASNERISELMRNLERSAWFSTPDLEHVRDDRDNRDYGPGASTFEMSFVLRHPAAGGDVLTGLRPSPTGKR